MFCSKPFSARFLVPLLLDIQLHKLLPALFSPPILRGLQDERNTFTGLRRTKRRERLLLMGALLSVVGTVARPRLAAQVAYAGLGVSIGFGGTKLLRLVRGGGLGRAGGRLLEATPVVREVPRLVASAGGWARGKLRAALLKMDPSLAESEGQSLGWRDLRPGRKGGKPKRQDE